jgi:hypothetical protein
MYTICITQLKVLLYPQYLPPQVQIAVTHIIRKQGVQYSSEYQGHHVLVRKHVHIRHQQQVRLRKRERGVVCEWVNVNE